MDFTENFTGFDEQLKRIDGIKWLPWIGQLYGKTKTVVLGESQYEEVHDEADVLGESQFEKGHDWQENNIEATRILIGKRFSGDRGKIYSNVEKVLLSLDSPTPEQGKFIWRSVAYWNLVPRLMSSRGERPSDTDFDNGWKLFFNMIEVIQPKPTTCIVLGKSSCGRLGYHLNNNETSWDRNVKEFYEPEKIINLSKNGHQLKLIFINHPSGSFGFNYKYWAQLVAENEPNLRQLLSQS